MRWNRSITHIIDLVIVSIIQYAQEKLVITPNTYLLPYKYPYSSTLPSSSTSKHLSTHQSPSRSTLEPNSLHSDVVCAHLSLLSYKRSFPTSFSPYSIKFAASSTTSHWDLTSGLKIIVVFAILALYTSKSSFRRRIPLYKSDKCSPILPTLPCELNADCVLLKLEVVITGNFDLMFLNFCCEYAGPW